MERVGGFDTPFSVVVPQSLNLDDTRIYRLSCCWILVKNFLQLSFSDFRFLVDEELHGVAVQVRCDVAIRRRVLDC
jgi:hypothetical protein